MLVNGREVPIAYLKRNGPFLVLCTRSVIQGVVPDYYIRALVGLEFTVQAVDYPTEVFFRRTQTWSVVRRERWEISYGEFLLVLRLVSGDAASYIQSMVAQANPDLICFFPEEVQVAD